MNKDIGISAEIEKAKYYLLIPVSKKIKIPQLTLDNVARVEAMIQTDSRYSNNSNKFNKDTSAEYLKKLKCLLESYEELECYEKRYRLSKCIYNIVRTIDKENSTHLNSNIKKEDAKGVGIKKAGRYLIADKILQFDKTCFLNHLMNPIESLNEGGLFRIIEMSGGRKNTSFASKFCHYACFYLFDDKNRDNYSIYDAVIRRALPVYIKLYKGKIKLTDNSIKDVISKKGYKEIKRYLDDKDYDVYQKVIDAVRDASGKNISRNGFDHLLWYYFKGKNEEEIEAIYNCIN